MKSVLVNGPSKNSTKTKKVQLWLRRNEVMEYSDDRRWENRTSPVFGLSLSQHKQCDPCNTANIKHGYNVLIIS